MRTETVMYLKDRPTRSVLKALVSMLEDPVEDLVRKDSRFKRLDLNPDDYVGNARAVVDVLAAHPSLMQRPVLVKKGRAIIGRPRERVGAFLS